MDLISIENIYKYYEEKLKFNEDVINVGFNDGIILIKMKKEYDIHINKYTHKDIYGYVNYNKLLQSVSIKYDSIFNTYIIATFKHLQKLYETMEKEIQEKNKKLKGDKFYGKQKVK